MSKTLYIEASVISYLTSRPSNDVTQSACQKMTQSWWERGRSITISPYVVEEASLGEP